MMLAETQEALQEKVRQRAVAFRLTFGSQPGREVLKDLATFCRAFTTCMVPGSNDLTWAMEGRREVFNYIMEHMNFSPDELMVIHRAARLGPAQGE